MSKVSTGTISLYCCGGTGINIGKQFEKFREHSEFGMAQITPIYIDTSKSNAAGVNQDYSMFFEGMDGSGKVRAENYQEISNHIKKILKEFEPGDLSIVLSSASGGSGSVIAPSILSELLSEGKPVIAIMIGSTDSALEIKNTVNTLKSLENIAKIKKSPVVMGYFENSKQTSRKVVDDTAMELITTLMTVYSRSNDELDSQDLYNFLNFDRVTSYEPALVGITRLLTSHGHSFDSVTTGNVIGLVSLLNRDQQLDLDFIPDYQTVGYLPEDISTSVKSMAPISLVILANSTAVIYSRLAELQNQVVKAQQARVGLKSIIDKNDKATDTGLIL